jgi:hypothetical protein
MVESISRREHEDEHECQTHPEESRTPLPLPVCAGNPQPEQNEQGANQKKRRNPKKPTRFRSGGVKYDLALHLFSYYLFYRPATHDGCVPGKELRVRETVP